MAEMAGQGESQGLKFDCPEGLIVLGQVKYYDYIENDEFKKKANEKNGIRVDFIIHINRGGTHHTRNFHDRINEEEEKPYLWQNYHLYTIKMPPCNPKLEGKRSLNCYGYLKDKS